MFLFYLNTINFPRKWIYFIGVIFIAINFTTAQSNFKISSRWDYPYQLNKNLEKTIEIPVGPFARLDDDEIVCASSPSGKEVLISEDNGKSWKSHQVFSDPGKYTISAKAIQCTNDGVVVLAFSNILEKQWNWSDSLGDAPGAVLPTYVVRSLDRGRTWEEPVKLHDEWTGYITDMIITSDGAIVFTSMMMRHNPGRHTVLTYMSEDDGATWHRSNVMDMGGAGHHGGLTEPTLVEQNDGRLMMLIRTNWMEFWWAESKDSGRSWHLMGPSGIPASPSHGQMERLASGRIILVWNQPFPKGESSYPMVGGDRIWSAVPVSNFRGELSMAISEDDGKSWSEPVVIASTATDGFRKTGAGGKGKYMPNKEVSYPYVFEFAPGEIWITTARGPVRAKLYEKDFVD